MLLHSFIASSAALLACAPSALAFFNSTSIPSSFGGQDIDLTSFSGQRVVKIDRSTPPSITSTSIFFNLFGALEINEDFPKGADQCAGYEACVVRTVTFEDSESMTVNVIPLSQTSLDVGTSIVYENNNWGDSQYFADLQFLCMTESTNDESLLIDNMVRPEETNSPFLRNVSSNFLGVNSVFVSSNSISVSLSTNATCAEEALLISQQNSGSIAWSIIKYILIAILIALAVFFAATAYVKHNNGATGVDLLPSSQTILDIPYAAGDFARKVTSGITGSQTTQRDGYAVF
ncbi:autophagy-related protein 27 [Lipomyces oligophaga]|uniref:autophagy-related protein 27 n=1 Tax=Lipomyces oligophaga TaxID=45792 RepID=UPI0034CDB66E